MSEGSTGRASGFGQQVQVGALAPQGLEIVVDGGTLDCNLIVSAVFEVTRPDLTTTQWPAVILERQQTEITFVHLYAPGDVSQLGRYAIGVTLTLNTSATVPTTQRPLFVLPLGAITE